MGTWTVDLIFASLISVNNSVNVIIFFYWGSDAHSTALMLQHDLWWFVDFGSFRIMNHRFSIPWGIHSHILLLFSPKVEIKYIHWNNCIISVYLWEVNLIIKWNINDSGRFRVWMVSMKIGYPPCSNMCTLEQTVATISS